MIIFLQNLSFFIAQAQETPLIPPEVQQGITNSLTLVRDLLFGFAGIVGVIFIIVGAIRYITASGNEKQLEEARLTILYSIAGLVIMIIAWVFVVTIQNLLTGQKALEIPTPQQMQF
jgi:uncharacterized membrane protein YidH (DUF202 family)